MQVDTFEDSAHSQTSDIEIRRVDISSPESQRLINELNAELEGRYPEEGANFFHLGADEVKEGRGGFFIAFSSNVPVGCGAVRVIEPGVAEIKRMYVAPNTRGRGIGRLIVDALEQTSRQLGAHRIVLETGPRQPEAIALYSRAGFVEIPLFGEYIDSKFSVCMAKAL
jgi:GNAT superfamily N-acetyltransferase